VADLGGVALFRRGERETQAALDQCANHGYALAAAGGFPGGCGSDREAGEKNRDEAVAQLGAYLEDPAPFTVLVWRRPVWING